MTNVKCFLVSVCLILSVGCATPASRSKNEDSFRFVLGSEHLEGGKISCRYFLGHDSHALEVEWGTGGGMVKTFLDKEMVAQAVVQKANYLELIGKIKDYFRSQEGKEQHSLDMCKRPFEVAVSQGEKRQALQGCREWDEGKFSNLIRDVEFLMYSKK